MTKKKIRLRLIDISHGAGMDYCAHGDYFNNTTLEALNAFCNGIQVAGLLPEDDSIFKLGWHCCHIIDDLDNLTDHVFFHYQNHRVVQ